ncbi:MAG: sugar phosphate nucleotidyltransferase [Chloroflexota bacterium]
MKIKKAVITVAGKNQRTLPLQTLIDRDGKEKSVLGVIVKEVLEAGVEEIGLVIRPGDGEALARVASNHAGNLRFIPQIDLQGYGHAIFCAREFVEDAHFLHLVGDHIYISRGEESYVQHLLRVAEREMCSVATVQPTRENLLPYYGAVGGRRLSDRPDLYRVETVIEKPTPTEAEQRLMVSGLRSGHYLCFFGMHVLMPTIMTVLGEQLETAVNSRNVTLSSALHTLAQREQVLALEKRDWRYDLGVKYGLMTAQLALALSGQDRDYVLTKLVELLATRE